MPFAIANDDELKKQQEGQGANISGQSTTFGVNVPGQKGPSGPKSSGQYQNIQKYLSANEEQGTQMGQQVAQGVENKIGEAKQQGQALQSSIKGPEAYDPNKVLGNLGGATEEEKKTYQSTKQTGGYTGPKSIQEAQGYGGFQSSSQKAQEALGQSSTDVGQQQLASETFGRPQYTGGAKSLDQSLMARSSGGKSALEGLQNKYSNLLGELGSYETQANQSIDQAKAQAEANKALFNPAEQEAKRNIINPIEQRAAQANQLAGNYDTFLSDLQDLNLSTDTLNALGLQAGQRTYGLNLGQFLNPATMQATVGNIATQGERQKYNDLMNFLGTNAGELQLGEPTYQGITTSADQMQKALAAKEAEFKNATRGVKLTGDYGSTSDYGSAFERDLGLPQTESIHTYGDFGSVEDMLASGLTPEEYINRQALKYNNNNLLNRDQMIQTINDLLNQYHYNDVLGVETNKDLSSLLPGGSTGGIKGGLKGGV